MIMRAAGREENPLREQEEVKKMKFMEII